MSGRCKDDVLPCDQTKVHGGGTYDALPNEWRGRTRPCASCHVDFIITAAEQRFWYEELSIPLIVDITSCPACRSRARALRHIAGRLSDLVPKVRTGVATQLEQRELVLTVARAISQTVVVMIGGHATPMLSGRPLIEATASLATRLRREQPGNHDLLPVLILLHRQLGNTLKMEKLEGELASLTEKMPALAKPVRRLRDWLAAPNRRLWTHVSQPTRL
jgi:hypothetical protein